MKSIAGLFIAAAVSAVLAGCDRKPAASSAGARGSPSTASPGDPTFAALPAGDGPRLPGSECLLTEQGIPRKVLPIREGVKALDEPRPGAGARASLPWFRPRYVAAVSGPGPSPGWFQIASARRHETIEGWVPAEAVVEWNLRVVAAPARGATGTLTVHSEVATLKEIADTGRSSCPPIASVPLGSLGPYVLPVQPWPILERMTHQTPRGEVKEFLKVAFLARARDHGREYVPAAAATAPAPPRKSLEDARRANLLLDVRCAIDITGSMKEFMAATAATVTGVNRLIAEWAPSLALDPRFGLTVFRDHDDPLVHKTFPLGDAPAFAGQLGSFDAAGGSDTPEAVHDAIQEALQQPWRGDGLNLRFLYVVADAPAHEPGDRQNPKNISRDQLVAIARTNGVKIIGILVGPDDSPERRLRTEQLQDLATRTGGICLRADAAAQVFERVKPLVQAAVEEIRVRNQVVTGLQKGQDLPAIARDARLPIEKVTLVWDWLASGGVALPGATGGTPAFATGWIDGDAPGVGRFTLISRSEVDVLIATLSTLCAWRGSDFGNRLVVEAVYGRVLERFLRGTTEPTLEVYLQALGIPAGRTSILRLTPDQIRHMGEEQRARLRDRLGKIVIPGLIQVRNDDAYWTGRTDELGEEWGLIPEEVLP